jgi:hypothetical protein
LRGREAQRAARFVEHDKIVAGSLHLGKADSHRGIIATGTAPDEPEPVNPIQPRDRDRHAAFFTGSLPGGKQKAWQSFLAKHST